MKKYSKVVFIEYFCALILGFLPTHNETKTLRLGLNGLSITDFKFTVQSKWADIISTTVLFFD